MIEIFLKDHFFAPSKMVGYGCGHVWKLDTMGKDTEQLRQILEFSL